MTNLELTDEEFSLVVWAINYSLDELEDRDMKSLMTLVNKLTTELKKNLGESHVD
jgi:hypothetical protein